jgi:hypothetical protein
MATVVELMRQRADKKVALLAAQHVQDRAYGRPREKPPDQRGRIVLALDSLSTEELEVLERALRKGLIRVEGDPTDLPPALEADPGTGKIIDEDRQSSEQDGQYADTAILFRACRESAYGSAHTRR